MTSPSKNTEVALEAPAGKVGIHDLRKGIYAEIENTRVKAALKYPGTTLADDVHSETERAALVLAELGEATEEAKMLRYPWTRTARLGREAEDGEIRARLRVELAQVAAMCVAWLEFEHRQEAYFHAG